MIEYIKDKSPAKKSFPGDVIEITDSHVRESNTDTINGNGVDVLAYFIANGPERDGAVRFMHKIDQLFIKDEYRDEMYKTVIVPNKEHIAKATKIRDYYNGRGTMQMLQGELFSHFKSDLYKFTSNHITQVHGKYFGILNKIQEFVRSVICLYQIQISIHQI